jgi:hypothetical protein
MDFFKILYPLSAKMGNLSPRSKIPAEEGKKEKRYNLIREREYSTVQTDADFI